MTPTTIVSRADLDVPVAVIGDIHGRSDLLRTLLAKLGERPIFVMGDVCDRGPDSRGVIDLLVVHGARGVLGNHDEWLLRWARGEGFDDFALSPAMGGRATLDSYGVASRSAGEIEAKRWVVPGSHVDWLETLSVAYDLRVMGHPFWLVHAGIPTWVRPEPDALDTVVPFLAAHHGAAIRWTSTRPEQMPAVDRPVVMGHLPLDAPLDLGHVIAIDTGCGRADGALTAVLLPERRFVTVRSDGSV